MLLKKTEFCWKATSLFLFLYLYLGLKIYHNASQQITQGDKQYQLSIRPSLYSSVSKASKMSSKSEKIFIPKARILRHNVTQRNCWNLKMVSLVAGPLSQLIIYTNVTQRNYWNPKMVSLVPPELTNNIFESQKRRDIALKSFCNNKTPQKIRD